jgi:hypothetical protein
MYFLLNYSAGVPLEYSLLTFLANDILQFAGITFIAVAIFKKLNLSHTQILLIAILLSLIVSYPSGHYSAKYVFKSAFGQFH